MDDFIPTSLGPPPETILQRAIRRTKENPVIPAATLVAVYSVVAGSRRLFARDSKGLQKSMRLRVAAQTVAFGALAVSLTYEAMKRRSAAAPAVPAPVPAGPVVEGKTESSKT